MANVTSGTGDQRKTRELNTCDVCKSRFLSSMDVWTRRLHGFPTRLRSADVISERKKWDMRLLSSWNVEIRYSRSITALEKHL